MKLIDGDIFVNNEVALKIESRDLGLWSVCVACRNNLTNSRYPHQRRSSAISDLSSWETKRMLGKCKKPDKKELAKIKLVLDW